MPAPDFAQQVFAPLFQSASRGGATRTFLVLSANGEPRWFLPAGQRKVAPVLAVWSPYRFCSRLKWNAVRAANRAGCLSSLPGITTSAVTGFDSIDWTSVGWNSDQPPVVAVYLGTPGPSRKAVIHLLDSASGVCQAIVKVPINDGGAPAILREADTLISLATENFACAPRLLTVDRERGISAQTVLLGTSGSRRLLPEYLQLLRSLRLPGETTTLVQHAASLQEQLLWSASSQHELTAITAALSQLCDANPLPAFWVHGDFAPWNFKHRGDCAPALLDWEDARRGGLPLQDAFHFLHIQDYLFGKRPTAHAKKLNPFATESGITAGQCHKLEISYLVHSYLQRLTRQQTDYSKFLLDTLSVALQDGQRAAGPSMVRRNQAPAKSASSPVTSHIRSDLFSAVIAEFNLAQLPYCILSGYEGYPQQIPSDVDFMVHPADMSRIPTLLAQAADHCGARVLQALRHEISACYFVLGKENGHRVGFLNPDCCGDYRRRGRLWLRAGEILAARRPCKNFYVPSAPDEFIYYFIKKVLKQSIDTGQMQRLQGLHQRAPHACRDRLLNFWPALTADAIEQALVAQDTFWFAANSELLLAELEASRPREHRLDRFASTGRRIAAFLKRALQPTGMCVILSGSATSHDSNIATALQETMEPAFRWTNVLRVAEHSHSDPANHAPESSFALGLRLLKLLRTAIRIRVACMRSTLVVCAVERRGLRSACGNVAWSVTVEQPAPKSAPKGRRLSLGQHGAAGAVLGKWKTDASPVGTTDVLEHTLLPCGTHRLSSWFMRLMFRSDLVFVLTSSHFGISTTEHGQRSSLPPALGRCPPTYLDERLPFEETVYQATRVILQWLSTRQVRRQGPLTSSEAPFSQDSPDPAGLPCMEAK